MKSPVHLVSGAALRVYAAAAEAGPAGERS